MTMNTDKAYLLGLVLGGGVFGEDRNSLYIKLPFKQWGDVVKNPKRAGEIGSDIINVIKPIFKSLYQIDVSYTVSSKEWHVLCDGDLSILKEDLLNYGVSPRGELRKDLEVEGILAALVDDNMKRRFVAGLADTIGSTTKTHRRFSDDTQILSFELKGHNFNSVCTLCRLLSSINCYPDQVNWNHPNIHCGYDPYYKQWNKGFKIRVILDQYSKFGAFAFKTKAESANSNRALQKHHNTAKHCLQQPINVTPRTVHKLENNKLLPEVIRGGHYIHYKHICAVLGCENVPYNTLNKHISNAEKYIIPFPLLHKDSYDNMMELMKNELIYGNRTYSEFPINVEMIFDIYNTDRHALMWGNSKDNGYPISQIVQAIAFIIASISGELNGKRYKDGCSKLIKGFIEEKSDKEIFIMKPDLLTPIVITDYKNAAMVGPMNPQVYKKLISRDDKIKYKLYVRDINEEDLK